MRLTYRLLVVLMGVLVVVGCTRERPRKPSAGVLPAPREPQPGVQMGNVAPDIEGVDLDGKTFKLSDYKGKVVVLDFWGNWCPPCRAMYPHNRVLVKKYQDKPFAFLGVNSGDTKTMLLELRDEGTITWRVWLDEPQGLHASAWGIDRYPRIFILDGKGVIRHVIEGGGPGVGKQLEGIVEALLGEMESAGKSS